MLVYINPEHNWKIIICEGLWGYAKYEVEQWNGSFWETRYDGEGNLAKCFNYLFEHKIISKDEKKHQISKWCR